jgi:hypothetical protein
MLPGLLATLLALGCLLHGVCRGGTDEVVIAHFGDSTCITSYLPKEQRVDAVLNARLLEHYKGQKIRNVNVGLDGDHVRQFLDAGRYAKDVKNKLPRIDIALIRYGQNDMKRIKPEEFKKHLEELCDKLLADYPGVQLVLETNTFVDPKHGGSDGMNKQYNLYWDVLRTVAKERKYPLVEIFERRKKEIESGNWDLCIRNQALSKEKFGKLIVDGSKDAEMAAVPKWFGDSHPNPNAVKVLADEEFKALTATWPQKLPRAK